MEKSITPYVIYTDGSCKGKGRAGGWAYVILHDGDIITKDCGKVLDTTNQQMELTAAINGIKAALKLVDNRKTESFIVYSDSAYLVNCYTDSWWQKWINNGWINSKNEPVKNAELWNELIPYFNSRSFTFAKVAGHSGIYYNEMCDKMAQGVAKVDFHE